MVNGSHLALWDPFWLSCQIDFKLLGFKPLLLGKGADASDRRPQLMAALAAARKLRCHVAVAKLDRLSREVHFISGLMAHKVPFLVAKLARMLIPSSCTS